MRDIGLQVVAYHFPDYMYETTKWAKKIRDACKEAYENMYEWTGAVFEDPIQSAVHAFTRACAVVEEVIST